MESPLWIDTYAPSIHDLPQADLRDYLSRASKGPINLVLHGPPGSGKTAAARALAHESHADPDNDFLVINVADFFDMTKSELTDDPRFAQFLSGRSDMAKGAMVNYVLKEMASYSPMSGEYKTILLDNAEGIREDFQQALRRVMERHYEATQFIITTRQPTKLIPPITSRCFPIPVRGPTEDETVDILSTILDSEDVPYDPMALDIIASHADGDLRTAILETQTVAEAEGELTPTSIEILQAVGPDDRIADMIAKARDGDFTDARSILDDLLVDDGYTGDEILTSMMAVATSRDLVDPASFAQLAGEIDLDLASGTTPRIHLAHLLATLGSE